MASEDEIPLGPLTGAERSAIATHFKLMSTHTAALAKLFDPQVKSKVGRPSKDGLAPKDKREKRAPTAYNNFISAKIKPYKAEVRRAPRASRPRLSPRPLQV
jgi:hypothetical protein